MQIKFQPSTQPNQLQGTTILPVVQLPEGQQPAGLATLATLCDTTTDVLAQRFTAATQEIFPVVRPHGLLLLVGLGSKPDFASTLKTCQQLAAKHDKFLHSELTLQWLPSAAPDNLSLHTEAVVNGLVQGCHNPGVYKTRNDRQHPILQADTTLTIVSDPAQETALLDAAHQGRIIGETQLRIMALVDAPANFKTPAHLAQYATHAGQTYGFNVQVMNKEALEANGMHALLAVGQGSVVPPAMLVMEYKGKANGNGLPTIGLVGKGVTFDTGGISIKPSANMHYMKSDMGGAAAVLGTIEAAAKLQLPVHLVGIVPTTENCIDALAVKPGDVISSYSGKSIEVIDTDAEGRLILADGLSYVIRNYHPQVVIDLATLTGASVRTFGYLAAALFSNDDQLAHHLAAAGQQTGERVWPLPLWDEYGDDMKSDVADIKNFSGKPVAGAISAAKFLEFFIDQHPSWAHLDIAGVAFGDMPYGKGKTASGYGVRLLIQFLKGGVIVH
ncbi:MAG: leucyl aminopeptidase family protein [Saprospiraceae bacterium]